MKISPGRVSVIIPAYNNSRYIGKTLESALAQTYKDIEIIVVNDGSPDDIESAVAPYKEKITYFRKENGGPASARNAGIKVASGEYIAFLDGDDLWEKNKVARQVAYLEKHPDIGFVHTDAIGFYDDATKTDRLFACDLEGNTFKNIFWSNFIIFSSSMVRRNCMQKVGLLNESPNFIGGEDYEYWVRFSRRFKLGVLHEPLTLYRLRPDSLIGESYDKAFRFHALIYQKTFTQDSQKTALEIGMSKREALSDLYFRYAYHNLVAGEIGSGALKASAAVRYAPLRSVRAVFLIALRRSNDPAWESLIGNWQLWRKIVGASDD